MSKGLFLLEWVTKQYTNHYYLFIFSCVILGIVLLPIMMMLVILFLLVFPIFLFVYLFYLYFLPIHNKPSKQRSIEIGIKKSGEGIPRRHFRFRELLRDYQGCTTLGELLELSVEKYASRPAVGFRKTIKVETKVKKEWDEKEQQWKERKWTIPWQTNYQWRTYEEFGKEAKVAGNGLRKLGAVHGQRVAIFAATRPDWQIVAHGAFQHGIVIVTAYPSLGVEALVYALNQTHILHLVTQADKLDIVAQTIPAVPSLESIIYFDEIPSKRLDELQGSYPKVRFISYAQLLLEGTLHQYPPTPPSGKDLAVIMYTSGSTGTPKGVMITHQNVISAAVGIMHVPYEDPLNETDTYIAYLPLAHVLELVAETLFLAVGARLGYSSTLTLKDDQVCDANGNPLGDIRCLQPTVMAAVPLILDRLKRGVIEQVRKTNIFVRTLFYAAFSLKRRSMLRGHSSPILDMLVFNKVAAALGGRIRYLLSGGSPLSKDTQEFINVVFKTPVLQGYGLTETLAGGCITHPKDMQPNNVGAPVPSCEVKLIDVPEMGYTSDDRDPNTGKPTPRGEICIRGGNVALGYFDLQMQSSEVFKKERGDEFTWFHTGDVGEWKEDGTLSIIDRKKDLVKLSHGEYLALGNLESIYGHSALVDNICICANSEQDKPIAIVVFNHEQIKSLAQGIGVSSHDLSALAQDASVKQTVIKELDKYAAQSKLEKFQRIGHVILEPEPWTPDNGMLTEAMKLKRSEITKRYARVIEEAYSKTK